MKYIVSDGVKFYGTFSSLDDANVCRISVLKEIGKRTWIIKGK